MEASPKYRNTCIPFRPWESIGQEVFKVCLTPICYWMSEESFGEGSELHYIASHQLSQWIRKRQMFL